MSSIGAGGCLVVPSVSRLPFPDESFDTVSFIACLNHIPDRAGALAEARRVLTPGGRVVLTMIGRLIGAIGHRLWWYGEHHHRAVAEGETDGLDPDEMLGFLSAANFQNIRHRRFVYGLNSLYVAEKSPMV
jgi:SAM-dependent methyltransferase